MLITSIDTLKTYIPAIVGADISKYSYFLDTAEEWLRREILGNALYNIVADGDDYYPTGESDVEPFVLDDVADYCRAVVAYKAYSDGIPHLDLVETENGFAVVSNNNLVPASQQRVAALQTAMFKKLDDAIESLLEYLEETAELHDPWKGSPAYTLLSDLYITTVKQFRRYVVYEGSRRDFIKMKPEILNAVNLKIVPVISQELSDAIIEELRDEDMTPANNAILENLRFAMCNFAMKLDDIGTAYLMRVRKVLYANPEDYPEFEASDIYVQYLASLETAAINNTNSPLYFAGI